MENNQQSFWQFSDQLRVHTANMANLSLNDFIWNNSDYYTSKIPDDRRNFDAKVGGSVNSSKTITDGYKPAAVNVCKDFNFGWKNDLCLDDGWKVDNFVDSASQMNVNGVFSKGVYSSAAAEDYQINMKMKKKKMVDSSEHGGKEGLKKSNNRKNSNDGGYSNDWKTATDKRFKTLPPAEVLPRNETIGGYIFVCNNDTMEENLQRQLFGLPPRYRDSVRQITPGLPLFLYNYSNHQLHGIFEAASFGGSNIDPTAWEDKKCPAESRFPAQVRVLTRKVYDEPLEEDSFRPILHHYDGPKFRLELSVPEALSLLDVFAEQE